MCSIVLVHWKLCQSEKWPQSVHLSSKEILINFHECIHNCFAIINITCDHFIMSCCILLLWMCSSSLLLVWCSSQCDVLVMCVLQQDRESLSSSYSQSEPPTPPAHRLSPTLTCTAHPQPLVPRSLTTRPTTIPPPPPMQAPILSNIQQPVIPSPSLPKPSIQPKSSPPPSASTSTNSPLRGPPSPLLSLHVPQIYTTAPTPPATPLSTRVSLDTFSLSSFSKRSSKMLHSKKLVGFLGQYRAGRSLSARSWLEPTVGTVNSSYTSIESVNHGRLNADFDAGNLSRDLKTPANEVAADKISIGRRSLDIRTAVMGKFLVKVSTPGAFLTLSWAFGRVVRLHPLQLLAVSFLYWVCFFFNSMFANVTCCTWA